MSALLASAPLLLRRRGAIADLLPIIAFAAATGIIATVTGGLFAFIGRLPSGESTGALEGEDAVIGFLVICAAVASALLLPSAIGFGGSAARLSLVRRERDLAAMRLVGGTTGQVGGIAVLDVAAQALLGAIAGIALHLAATPLLTHLDFGITAFTVGELLLPWWAYPLIVLGIALLAVGSAAISLTGVVLSPLGVARDSRTIRMSVMRVVAWGLLILAFIGFSQIFGAVAQADLLTGITIMVLMIGAVVAGVNVAGPFIVWAVARAVAALSPSPSLLVGARRLAADPRSGWRAVSIITFALIIAGMLTSISSLEQGTTPEDTMITTAMRAGGMLTLGIAAVLAAVSTGVTQTARVIDHAPQLRSQHIAGAEVGQLHRARLAEIAIPVLLSSVLAAGTALLVVVSVIGGATSDPAAGIQYLVSVAGAYALVIGAVLVSSPLVRRYAVRTA